MARRRLSKADDQLRSLRREAAIIASELARKLQHAPAEIEIFGPMIVGIFCDRDAQLFFEIDENQGRYEGREESWFCLLRQVRNHGVWGQLLFEALRSDYQVTTLSPPNMALLP